MTLSWTANAVSLLRLLLIIPYFLLLSNADLRSRLFALILGIFIAITDKLDGYLARKFKSTSRYGDLLDSLGDYSFIILSLAFFYVEGTYPLIFFFLLLLPRLISVTFALYDGLHRGHWHTKHLIGDKVAGVTNYLIVLWLLIPINHPLFILWIAAGVQIIAAVHSTFIRFSTAKAS